MSFRISSSELPVSEELGELLELEELLLSGLVSAEEEELPELAAPPLEPELPQAVRMPESEAAATVETAIFKN